MKQLESWPGQIIKDWQLPVMALWLQRHIRIRISKFKGGTTRSTTKGLCNGGFSVLTSSLSAQITNDLQISQPPLMVLALVLMIPFANGIQGDNNGYPCYIDPTQPISGAWRNSSERCREMEVYIRQGGTRRDHVSAKWSKMNKIKMKYVVE